MTIRSRPGLSPAECRALVERLAAMHSELSAARLKILLKSPTNAALHTLQKQIAEIVGHVTGDWDKFKGKPRTMNVAPPGSRY